MFGRIKGTSEEGLFPAKYVESFAEKQTSFPRPLRKVFLEMMNDEKLVKLILMIF